jgi:hypothetical protein
MTEQHPDIEQRVQPQPPDAEHRSLTDVALLLGPPLGAVTAWGLSQYGPDSDPAPSQQDEPKEVILPPGVDPE